MVDNVEPEPSSEGTRPPGESRGRRIVPVAPGRSIIAKCRKSERKLIRQITTAVQRGARQKALRLADLYLKSGAARVVGIIEADKKLRELEQKQLRRSQSSRPARPLLTPHQVLELATQLSPYNRCQERVTAWYESKQDGGLRLVLSFGIRKRAMQLMVKQVLMPFFDPHHGQYILRGGRTAACAAVRDALERGFKWAVHADVRDCFGSLDREGLRGVLPLPVRVIDNVVFGHGSDVVRYDENGRPCFRRVRELAGGQRSIPQGSSASPIVADIALKPLLADIPGNVVAVNYGDNVLVLTRTRAEALTIKELLASAAEQMAVGPLELHKWSIRRTADGFRFLGYVFSTRGGVVSARPCDEKRRLKMTFFEACILAHHQSAVIISDIMAWTRQYPLWAQARAFEQFWIDKARAVDWRRENRLCRLADAIALRRLLRTHSRSRNQRRRRRRALRE